VAVFVVVGPEIRVVVGVEVAWEVVGLVQVNVEEGEGSGDDAGLMSVV